ncbi:MAG: ferrous iron transport protein B [Candidatus Omnitrophota bacterium]
MSRKITIALAGNPNSGKTTIFNNLTGFRQKIGNYSGVTVEKFEGILEYKGYSINIVDLPGTYSLTAQSLDEVIARNFVIEEKPDVVVNVIDCSNLERNLYLSTQFLELGAPLILAFNMYDMAQQQGLAIDVNRLSELFGSRIVLTVASKKKGMDELLDAVIDYVEHKEESWPIPIGYGAEVQEELEKIKSILIQDEELTKKYLTGWLALKLLEEDEEIIKKISKKSYAEQLKEQIKKSVEHLRTIFNDNPEAIIADGRYGFISGACSEAIRKTFETRHTVSDSIDKILINKVLGLPIFLAAMWLVFKFTFSLSRPLMNVIELLQEGLASLVGGFLPAGSAIRSLFVDGIIGGVGSVLVFLPVILLMYFAMSLLEYSGYMARAAFIMDDLMHKIGLHGRSFIPMLLGFGCNVPAIMAARAIEDRRDRIVTILVNSFMSCGARLPVYTLFIGAFFSEKIAGNILFSLYVLGIVVAIIVAKIFRKYLFRGEAAPFVMELPPYRIPALKGLLIHTWDRAVLYLKKAGTIIFAGCVLIWFLSNFPLAGANLNAYEKMENSYAGRMGKAVAPVFKPLGFGEWKIAVALVSGVVGKEIVVGTLGTLYSVGELCGEADILREELKKATRDDGSKLFTPLVAYSLMVFILLYIPCVATVGAVKQETQSWGWALFAVFYTTLVAWIASFIIYQGGRLFGLQ